MNDCRTLLNFISYFEDPMVIQLGYRQQDDAITDFIDEVYQCGILDKDYYHRLQEWVPTGDYEGFIQEADFEQLRLLLSYYVCQKNFATTLWEVPIKDKVFLRILFRLRTLVEA